MRLVTPALRAFVTRAASLVALALLLPAALEARQTPTLTLEEALDLARRNNPDYLAARNDAGPADWAVREAYGQLMPGANASGGLSWQNAGNQRFGIFTGEDLGIQSSTSYYSSSYNLGLSYRLSGSALLAPGREKAIRSATEAGIDASRLMLETNVTGQYLAVLRAQDGVTLARQELQRADENVRHAEARVAVGAAIPMEVKQAQVERGRAQVSLLQAENAVRTERLRLGQVIGVPLEQDITLTTSFAVTDFTWQPAELAETALAAKPQLLAARANERASETGIAMARSAYLPSLSLSAGFSGYTRQAANENFLVAQARDQISGQQENCQFLNSVSAGLSNPLPGRPADCSAFTLTPAQEARIRSENSVFPFDFTREPLSASLQISLPVFQGFSRERQVEEARAAAADAGYRLRAEELRIRTDVNTAYWNLTTARQSVDLEETNSELAQEQLDLARERYRLGAASFLELQEAETVKARADRAYLDAVYAFHEAIAALESAVGRPLREIR
jgi:outer membrane protein